MYICMYKSEHIMHISCIFSRKIHFLKKVVFHKTSFWQPGTVSEIICDYVVIVLLTNAGNLLACPLLSFTLNSEYSSNTHITRDNR